MQTLRASNGTIEPRFSEKVLRMSETELREYNNYLRRYLQSISPKVSVYASMERERRGCCERLAEVRAARVALEKKHG